MPTQRYFHSDEFRWDPWLVCVDEQVPDWHHGRLHVGQFDTDPQSFTLPAGQVEYLVIPLDGQTTVTTSHGQIWKLGRDSSPGIPYFGFPPDVAYLGAGSQATLTGTGRVAVASAPVPPTGACPSAVVARDHIEVVLRGAGRDSRQVHNLGVPGVVNAQRLIVCEVLTPAGNWSSYPPHKHDEELPGHETNLAEIYYFDAAPTPGLKATVPSTPTTGLFHSYSSPATDIAIANMVSPGDVALVPGGYHGPAAAAPQWDMYYLNVMVGPNTDPAIARTWLINDDPDYAWIREEWTHQEFDPRLPYHTKKR